MWRRQQAALEMQGTQQASGGWGWLGASDGTASETSSIPTDLVLLLQGLRTHMYSTCNLSLTPLGKMYTVHVHMSLLLTATLLSLWLCINTPTILRVCVPHVMCLG